MAGSGLPSIFPTWRYASGGRRVIVYTVADWKALCQIAPLDEWYDSPANIPAETPSLEEVSLPKPEPESEPKPRAAKRTRGRRNR